jgi:hypothetical protein
MKDFQLPDKARKELAEIFTEAMIPAIEQACKRYLYEDHKEKIPVSEDGRRLLEIGEKARELRQLLKDRKSTLERVHLHVSEEYGKHDTFSFIDDLIEKLRILDNMTFINPASDWAMNRPKGSPPGPRKIAERALAFRLWEIYRQAHGKAAPRIVDRIDNAEIGPLPRAAEILRPILKLSSNLAKRFREFGDNCMDNK